MRLAVPDIQPVILAGGSGTRLWPASRTLYPKQFLSLTGRNTMLQDTALRLRGKENARRDTLIVCNDAHRFLAAEQLRAIDVSARIVLEPEPRNTAPAVALAALLALRDGGNGTAPLLLVMPADHVIRDTAAFLSAIVAGEAPAAEGKLVAFGMLPSSPHTGYGYIEADARGLAPTPVHSFVEKPDAKTAVALLGTHRYFWNSGIFLFRADSYLEELEQFAPDMVAACRDSIEQASMDTDFIRPDGDAFGRSPADSIDYAVMEKTRRAVMVPLDAGLSDVGSWATVHETSAKDKDDNALLGDVVAIDCTSSYISSQSRLVTAVGLDNLVVVEDKDSVLVVSKDRTQDVSTLVGQLADNDRVETRLHRQVFRPWGSFDSLDTDDGFQVKRLIVNPGAELSLQKHARRTEHWIVVRGTARVTRNDEVFDLHPNESANIPIGTVHRIQNTGDVPVHIIEVQCGDYLGEDDIVRLQDDYGRQGTTN